MTPSPQIALNEIRGHFGHRTAYGSNTSSHRARCATTAAAFLGLGQERPYLGHTCAARGKHAILHAVQIAAVDGGNETAGNEAKDDLWCEVVLSESMT